MPDVGIELPPGCAGKYAAVSLLDSGGFGSAILATQLALNRPVVIKQLHGAGSLEPVQLARFLNEARLTASLSHANIVTVIDYGESAGVPWIAYEYLPGKSVAHLLDIGPVSCR